ncbi:MAG: adenylosuccinate synthase [candidate division KSB1 bacterium]|nr:adenylosuccinate synthase [candidate division KSB1 bacterium]
MGATVVIGAQWGDEGKGKIVDLLSEKMDIVARYQGGPNAGHTVVVKGEQIILHQLPSGLLWPHTLNVICNGVVIDPDVFVDELQLVKDHNIDFKDRLFISDRAHLIMPYHRELDKAKEKSLSSDQKIGTTGRGIGPAYMDKISRSGIRVCDLTDEPVLYEKTRRNVEYANEQLVKIFGEEPLDVQAVVDQVLNYSETIAPFITDTSVFLNRALHDNKSVLFEGAQGTMLDIDHGTYPFVTSSNPTAGGVCAGTGVAPNVIDEIWGIVKAYTTRVGKGPLPTEFDPEFAETVRELGGEFGATTGRPRRCGWFDAVVVRNSVRVNGLSGLVITKLDVLDSLESLKICTGYNYQGKVIKDYPADLTRQYNAEPVYETLPGWKTSTRHVTSYEQLPPAAKEYLQRIVEILNVPLIIGSVGPDREQTFFVE